MYTPLRRSNQTFHIIRGNKTAKPKPESSIRHRINTIIAGFPLRSQRNALHQTKLRTKWRRFTLHRSTEEQTSMQQVKKKAEGDQEEAQTFTKAKQ